MAFMRKGERLDYFEFLNSDWFINLFKFVNAFIRFKHES